MEETREEATERLIKMAQEKILEVKNLETTFKTEEGLVRAVGDDEVKTEAECATELVNEISIATEPTRAPAPCRKTLLLIILISSRHPPDVTTDPAA